MSRAISAVLRACAFALWLAGIASASFAQQKLVAAQSEIGFTSRQMGVPVDGRFTRFDAQMNFDPQKPETSRVALTVDLSSVSLGSPEVESELAKPGWFDISREPKARFESTAFKAAGNGRFEVAGRLTIKGQSRDLVVPVEIRPAAGGAATATGNFTLKRLQFRIGDGDWNDTSLVADDVQVHFKLALTGVPPG